MFLILKISCHKDANPNELPENFHTPLECPARWYDRVYPPKKEIGFVVIKDIKTNSKNKNGGNQIYYPVAVLCMKSHIYDKNVNIYNYYTEDGYSLESCVKHWKQTGEWISNDEYKKKFNSQSPMLRQWNSELIRYSYRYKLKY